MPKVPKTPPPPAPAPSALDPNVLAARQNERRRQMALYGRRATILAGASGEKLNQLSPPTLLGVK